RKYLQDAHVPQQLAHRYGHGGEGQHRAEHPEDAAQRVLFRPGGRGFHLAVICFYSEMRRVAQMISLCAGAAVCSAFAAECRLTKVAEWTVDASSGILVVEGAINGNQIGVALD